MDNGRAIHTDGRAKVFGEGDNCCFDPRASSKKNDISSDLQIFILGTDFQADSRNCKYNPDDKSYVQFGADICKRDNIHDSSNNWYLEQIKKTVDQVPTVTGVMFGGDATHDATKSERKFHDEKMKEYFTDEKYYHVFHGVGNHDISNEVWEDKKKSTKNAVQTYEWLQEQIKKYKKKGWWYTFEKPKWLRSNVDPDSLSYFIKRGSIAYFHLAEHYGQNDLVIDADEDIVLKSSGEWFKKVLTEFNWYFSRKDREDLKGIVLIYHVSDNEYGGNMGSDNFYWAKFLKLRKEVQEHIIKFNNGEFDHKFGRSYAKHPVMAAFCGHIHQEQKPIGNMGSFDYDDQDINWKQSKIPIFYIGSRENLAFVSLEINDKSDDPTKNWFRVYSHSYNPHYVPDGFSRWGFRKDHGYVGPMCMSVNGYSADNTECTRFFFVDDTKIAKAKDGKSTSTSPFQPGYPLPGYYRFGEKMSSGNSPNDGAVCPEGFRYSAYDLGGSDGFKFTGMHAVDGIRACGEWCRWKNFHYYDVPANDECKAIEYNHEANECVLKFGVLDVRDIEQGANWKSCIRTTFYQKGSGRLEGNCAYLSHQ